MEKCYSHTPHYDNRNNYANKLPFEHNDIQKVLLVLVAVRVFRM